MTGLSAVLLALAGGVAVVDWLAVHAGRTKLEYVAKPGTMVALLGVAVTLDVNDPAVRAWFVAALALSLVGDVFLMLPSDRFVFGLASFLLGHIAYIVGMWVGGVSWGGLALGALLVVAAIPLVGRPVVQSVQGSDEPELLGPVIAYIAVISAMVISAAGTGSWVAFGGAVLFYASDATIAWTRFIRELPAQRVIIMTTYHLAQAGLVLSLS